MALRSNMGRVEAGSRWVAGLLLLSLSLLVEWPGYWELAFLVAGAFFIGTAALRFCPAKSAMLGRDPRG